MHSKFVPSLVLASLAAFAPACASTITRVSGATPVRASAHWVLLPAANFADSPQAGERVEALLETVLRRRGIGSLDHYPPLKEDDAHLVMSDRERLNESLAWAKTQRFDYGVAASVEEWRYKSGLDGEPAVGVTVQVLDLATSRVLWTGSGTRTGAGGDNASGAALELLATLLDGLNVAP